MKKPVNPKFNAAATLDANERFLRTICAMGHTPNYDAEPLETKGEIQAGTNSFARARRHRIPTPVQDKRVQK